MEVSTENLLICKIVSGKWWKKYKFIDFDEFYSLSLIGLTKALNAFNGNRKTSFNTYATKCIEREFLKFLNQYKKRVGKVIYTDKIYDDYCYEENGYKKIYVSDLIKRILKIARIRYKKKKYKRMKFILCFLYQDSSMKLSEMAQKLNTTSETIRCNKKDIQAIAKELNITFNL